MAMLESFLVRRSVSFIPTQGLNRQFIRLSQQLPAGPDLVEATRAALSEPFRRWSHDDEFLTAFQSYPLFVNSKANQRRLIIESLEESYPNKERPSLSSFTTLTIEHVMPQALTPEWIADLGDSFHQVHTKLLHVPGNLTLTSFNSELGNIPFSKKKEILSQSHMELNREIVNSPFWTEKEIRERELRLAERALKIWPGPGAGG